MGILALLRNLARNRRGNLVSVAGLALGMMVAILSITYIVFELSYDRFHEEAGQIYIVKTLVTFESGRKSGSTYTAHGLKEYAGKHIPAIEASTRAVARTGNINAGEKIITNQEGLYVDPGFFNIFSFEMIAGSSAKFGDPADIILTEKTAVKLFGSINCDREIVGFDDHLYSVKGVISDPPANSNIRFDFLLPVENYIKDNDPGSRFLAVKTFIKTREKVEDYNAICELLDGYYTGVGNTNTRCSLMGITKLHQETEGTRRNFIMFVTISVLVLAVAGINFVNLFSAGLEQRARSIRIRIILGSSRLDIIASILVESVTITMVAALAGFILSELTLDIFRQLTGIGVTQYGPGLGWIRVIALTVALVTGIIAGFIPAIRYSGSHIVTGTEHERRRRRLTFRKSLVGLQYSISTGIMVVLVIFLLQLRFISGYDAGFDTENRLLVKLSRPLSMKYELFENEIKGITGVINVTAKTTPLGKNYGADIKVDRSPEVKPVKATGYSVKDNFFETYGISLLEGQTFSEIGGKDSSLVIIDRFTADYFDLANPVGKEIFNDYLWCKIIGVVENVDLMPLKGERAPVIYNQLGRYCSEVTVHYSGNEIPVINAVNKLLKMYDPLYEIEYRMADQVFAGFYSRELNLFKIILATGIIALLLSLVGAYAMTTYIIETRVQEVCIRKVMGANENEVLLPAIAGMVKVILLSFILSAPLALYISLEWLRDFRERIEVGPLPFIVSLVSFIIMVIMTTYFKIRKAAGVNPSVILRKE